MRPRSSFQLFLGFLGSAAVCLGAQDFQARLEKSLRDASCVTNIELTMVDILWMRDGPGLGETPADKIDFSRTFEYHYITSGGKYRATCRLVSGTRTNLAKLRESVFDGTSYITYDADQRHMAKSHVQPVSEPGQCPNSPLIAPFLFLSRQTDDRRSFALRFSDIATPGFLNGLILPAEPESDGLIHFSVPGRLLGKQPTLWRIDIDKNGDAFDPRMIGHAVPGFGQEIVFKLLGYTNVASYRFPTTIKWTGHAYGPISVPGVLATGMTSVISVRVPESVAGSNFLLDERSALRIWDSDQRRFAE